MIPGNGIGKLECARHVPRGQHWNPTVSRYSKSPLHIFSPFCQSIWAPRHVISHERITLCLTSFICCSCTFRHICAGGYVYCEGGRGQQAVDGKHDESLVFCTIAALGLSVGLLYLQHCAALRRVVVSPAVPAPAPLILQVVRGGGGRPA